jgi:uncharacterized protein (DUF2235 family)
MEGGGRIICIMVWICYGRFTVVVVAEMINVVGMLERGASSFVEYSLWRLMMRETLRRLLFSLITRVREMRGG